jgi:hypothetical protein
MKIVDPLECAATVTSVFSPQENAEGSVEKRRMSGDPASLFTRYGRPAPEAKKSITSAAVAEQ